MFDRREGRDTLKRKNMKKKNIILSLFLRVFFFRKYMEEKLKNLDPQLEEVVFKRHVLIFAERRLSRRALVFTGEKTNCKSREYFEIIVIDWISEIEYVLSPYRGYNEYEKGNSGAVKFVRYYEGDVVLEFYGDNYAPKQIRKRRA